MPARVYEPQLVVSYVSGIFKATIFVLYIVTLLFYESNETTHLFFIPLLSSEFLFLALIQTSFYSLTSLTLLSYISY
jgi:hypothetical protein